MPTYRALKKTLYVDISKSRIDRHLSAPASLAGTVNEITATKTASVVTNAKIPLLELMSKQYSNGNAAVALL